jgi:hypothetical protein
LQERATISLAAFHPGQHNVEVTRVSVMLSRGRSRLGNASAGATMHVAVQVIGLTLVRSGGEDGSEEGLSKNTFWSLPQGVPMQFAPIVDESNERPLRSPVGVTFRK